MRLACESGFLTEANEASENPINRKCCGGIGLICYGYIMVSFGFMEESISFL